MTLCIKPNASNIILKKQTGRMRGSPCFSSLLDGRRKKKVRVVWSRQNTRKGRAQPRAFAVLTLCCPLRFTPTNTHSSSNPPQWPPYSTESVAVPLQQVPYAPNPALALVDTQAHTCVHSVRATQRLQWIGIPTFSTYRPAQISHQRVIPTQHGLTTCLKSTTLFLHESLEAQSLPKPVSTPSPKRPSRKQLVASNQTNNYLSREHHKETLLK